MNTGVEFLNDAAFTWRILDASGATIDHGESPIVSLAPSETTSVDLAGTAQHDDNWTVVEFAFAGTPQ